jgi:hypothetical protein
VDSAPPGIADQDFPPGIEIVFHAAVGKQYCAEDDKKYGYAGFFAVMIHLNIPGIIKRQRNSFK